MVSGCEVVALTLYAFGMILGFLAGWDYAQIKRLREEAQQEGEAQ